MARNEGTVNTFEALSAAMADAVQSAGRSVVAIHARRRIPSSGIHWSPGIVVTAAHTLQRTQDIRVTLPDGTDVGAQLAGRDAGTDIAALRLDGGADFETATVAGPDALRAGALVLALGRPWRGPPTASLGLVSAVGDEWRTWQGGRIERMVRLDITVHDGFSGGPLIDAIGRVLGINTSTLARGAPLTVPVVTVERVLPELLSRGRLRRGFLGLAMHAVRLPESAREAGGTKSETALMVVGVEPDGPGERAGIVLGDVLIALKHQPVRELRDVGAILGPETIGVACPVRLLRAGAVRDLEVTIGERPEDG